MPDEIDYSGMSWEQEYFARALKSNLEVPIEEWAKREIQLGDWVFVDDYPAYNPLTGKPTMMRQVFTATRVVDGKATEVHPTVLNYPHKPVVQVTITPESRIRPYDFRLVGL